MSSIFIYQCIITFSQRLSIHYRFYTFIRQTLSSISSIHIHLYIHRGKHHLQYPLFICSLCSLASRNEQHIHLPVGYHFQNLYFFFHFIFISLRGCLRFPFYTFIWRQTLSSISSTFIGRTLSFIDEHSEHSEHILITLIYVLTNSISHFSFFIHSQRLSLHYLFTHSCWGTSSLCYIHLLATFLGETSDSYARYISSIHLLATFLGETSDSYHIFISSVIILYSYARYRSHPQISNIFTIQQVITFLEVVSHYLFYTNNILL